MTTCERELQSSEALAGQLDKTTQQPMSCPCPPVVLFLRDSRVGKKKLAAQMSSFDLLCSSCGNLFGPVLLTFFVAFLLSFFRCSVAAASSLSLVVLLPASGLFLFSSGPLPLLFSSWRASLTVSCCPFGVVIVLSFVVLLMSSFGLSVVLFTLLSEAGAGAAAAHHHTNKSCQLSCSGSMLV